MTERSQPAGTSWGVTCTEFGFRRLLWLPGGLGEEGEPDTMGRLLQGWGPGSGGRPWAGPVGPAVGGPGAEGRPSPGRPPAFGLSPGLRGGAERSGGGDEGGAGAGEVRSSVGAACGASQRLCPEVTWVRESGIQVQGQVWGYQCGVAKDVSSSVLRGS